MIPALNRKTTLLLQPASQTNSATRTANLDTLGVSINESTADPQFTDAAAGDFTIGTNLKALGWPSVIGAP